MFQEWRSKNIFARRLLAEKYSLNQKDQQLKKIAYRNLAAKRTARMGFIPGTSVIRDHSVRKKRSYKPAIMIDSSFFDVVLQDTYWRKKKKLRLSFKRTGNIYRILHMTLRNGLLKRIRKRLYYGLGHIYSVLYSNVAYRLFSLSYRFSSATFLSNYITRRLVMKFSINEIIPAYMRRHKRSATGFMVGCYGRFTRRQRSHKLKFKYGKVPLNMFSAPIDFKRKSCTLKYGVGGIRVWITRFLRTNYSKVKHYRRTAYVLLQRHSGRRNRLKNFSFRLPLKKRKSLRMLMPTIQRRYLTITKQFSTKKNKSAPKRLKKKLKIKKLEKKLRIKLFKRKKFNSRRFYIFLKIKQRVKKKRFSIKKSRRKKKERKNIKKRIAFSLFIC